MTPQAPRTETPAAGLEDVTRALRVLTRNSRELLVDGGGVLEREVAMAISISERLRDETFSAESLQQARSGELNKRLRDDAHRVVDLVADVGGVSAATALRFVEQLVDLPRVQLAAIERGTPEEGGAGGEAAAASA